MSKRANGCRVIAETIAIRRAETNIEGQDSNSKRRESARNAENAENAENAGKIIWCQLEEAVVTSLLPHVFRA
jgi:hypothetical protein